MKFYLIPWLNNICINIHGNHLITNNLPGLRLKINISVYFNFKTILTFLIVAIWLNYLSAQVTKNQNLSSLVSIGINYGQARQPFFFLHNPNYFYKNNYIKIQINYNLIHRLKYDLVLNLEPSLYFSQYQLLYKNFIRPKRGPDYLEQRERFSKRRTFHEYALNVGLIYRYRVIDHIGSYLLASIGPMMSEKDTERLGKGFAFSDIMGVGIYYTINKFLIDLRLTFRHNSNASLHQPNIGHNSAGIESGILIRL